MRVQLRQDELLERINPGHIDSRERYSLENPEMPVLTHNTIRVRGNGTIPL
jgi:hypothetical protein